MDLELTGKVGLVTGASVGIGRGIAQALAAEGVQLAILARRGHLLESLADEIVSDGGLRPHILVVDLTAAGAIERVRDEIDRTFGRLDILVNNAGASRSIPIDAPEEPWIESYELNFTAVRRLTHALLPLMRAQRFGRIVNLTGNSEPAGLNASSPAKAAVHSWSKGLSRLVAADGITVNSIAPGRINSEQILERLHPTPESRARYIAENIPVGYFGEPHDVGYLVAFLASPKARYLTGDVIYVDGGAHRFAF
ncbi:MAG: SDR family oxidoreductase [Chloroflexi bacterium]|nr:SDR family oxidoreductase [Chloroflexota bacterium]